MACILHFVILTHLRCVRNSGVDASRFQEVKEPPRPATQFCLDCVWCWNGDCEALKLHGFSGWMIWWYCSQTSSEFIVRGVTTGWSMEMPLTGPCATRRSPLNRGWVALFCIAGSGCHLFTCHKLRFDWSNPERASDFLCGVQTWLDKPYWLMRYSQKEPSNFFI
jgi:hypothetical protein